MNMLLFAVDFSTLILPIVLLVVIAVTFVMSSLKRNKYNEATKAMFDNIKVGVKVKTYAGIYGEIVEMRDALDGSKVAILKTGEGDKIGYISIDVASIYAIDEKDNEELFGEEANNGNENNTEKNLETLVVDSNK